jgi:hypothetical protein
MLTGVLRLILLSIAGSAAAELAYPCQRVRQREPAGPFPAVRYGLRVPGVIVTGIIEPSNLLFRNLKLTRGPAGQRECSSLFENMIDGFAYHRIITDEHGKPVDYVSEVNGAFGASRA